MSGSTHRAGHTLDLVLSLGLSITNVVVNDACFSDLLFVCFNAAFPSLNSVTNRSGHSTRLINTSTVDTFSESFFASSFCLDLEFSSQNLSVDGYFNYFNSVCTEILDEIAPLKYRESKK